MTEEAVLGDIRILDLSEDIAGPFCTKLLAGLGAEVVKVERPGTGDVARIAPPFLGHPSSLEASGLFLYLNTGKKSITLDIENVEGASLLRRLAEGCDVLVESHPPGRMESLGLGFDALSGENPGLIYTSITPFGQTGPYRDYKGSDIVAQAIGALMCVIGLPDREPLKVGGNPLLCTTGMAAFSATMLALHVRDAEGHGQRVDVSEMETTAVAQIHTSIHHQFGRNPERRPSNLTRARDGWVSPGLETGVQEETWPRVCELLSVPELADDPRFNSGPARRENSQELLAVVGQWAADRPKEEIYHTLQGLRSIAGYVATVEDLLASRQLADREFFQPVVHPATGELMYPGPAFRIEGETWKHERAPQLGEHNADIYGGALGYTATQLEQLQKNGVV